MESDLSSRTSVTLLGQLKKDPHDQDAWKEFVGRYGHKIYLWCRKWRLQDADARDVTQNVLLKLASAIHKFHYDPSGSFRAWLKTLAHHAWHDFKESQQRPGRGSGARDNLEMLYTLEARDDLQRRLNEEFDRELMEKALNRAKRRVEPQTWEAFRLTTQDEHTGPEAARETGMSVANVYKAKNRVQKLVQEEYTRLNGGVPGGSDDT